MNATVRTLPPPLQGFRVVELEQLHRRPRHRHGPGRPGRRGGQDRVAGGRRRAPPPAPSAWPCCAPTTASKLSVALDLRAPGGSSTLARRLIAARRRAGAEPAPRRGWTRWAWAPMPCATGPAGAGARVHCRLPGRARRLRDRPGYDIAAQAESGLMSVTGDPAGPAAEGGRDHHRRGHACRWRRRPILAALLRRQRTGLGETIQHLAAWRWRCSLQAAQLERLTWSAAYEPTAQRRRPAAWRHPAAETCSAPADGLVVVSAYVQAHWLRLCDTHRLPRSWPPTRASPPTKLRVANRPAMKAALGAAPGAPGHPRAASTGSQRQGLVAGRGAQLQPTRWHGEDFRASTMVQADVAATVAGSRATRSFGLPYELRGTPRAAPPTAAPAHGAHTRAGAACEPGSQRAGAGTHSVAAGVARQAAPVPP
jgi:crotonobetainyl-CoA:carnitine CoA-transferase CaiB-like acyl-CoA transferase